MYASRAKLIRNVSKVNTDTWGNSDLQKLQSEVDDLQVWKIVEIAVYVSVRHRSDPSVSND